MNARHWAFLALLVGPVIARADVAFSNLGPGDSFSQNSWWNISGSATWNGSVEPAFQFESAVSGPMNRLLLPLAYGEGTNGVNVWLCEDNAGAVGDMIMGWFVPNLPSVNDPYGLFELQGLGWYNLVAGTKYWLTVKPESADTFAYWNFNSIGDVGPWAESWDGGATYEYGTEERGAMRIETVPEPASLAVLAGLALLASRRRSGRA